MSRFFLKRSVDIALVTASLPVFVPALAIVSLLVRLKMGSPVFFRQPRPGRYGQIFDLYKFRTMTDRRDENGNLLPDEERLTSFGRFLRRTSLDELPSLWNVMRGQMSLVGPRPLLVEYLLLYSAEEMRRHDVLPGITGWAQINGRNALTWEEKFRLDLWYIDNWSIMLDLKILVLTLLKAFKGEGVHHDGHATMPPFKGHSGQDENGI